MKNILLFIGLLTSQLVIAQTYVDIEITSPQPNTLDIYIIPTAATPVSEITFTIRRLASCGASFVSPPTSYNSQLSFGDGNVGTATDMGFIYEGFTAIKNSAPFPTIPAARTKVMTINVSGSGSCDFNIANAPSPLLLNATFNIADNMGSSIQRNIINNANNVVLSVELTRFEATKKSETTILNWETTHEMNMSAYAIERSNDGKNFKPIGYEKPKAKNADDKVAYTFIDEKPALGINYYRLQMKGLDNSDIEYSKIVSVDFGSGVKGKSFPNPFTTELVVEVDIAHSSSQDVQIELFDVAGKQLFSQKVVVTGRKLVYNVPIADLVPGEYILRAKNGKDTWQQKISKQ